MPHDSNLIIHGGIPLDGELHVQPSKNAALPIIVASLLTPEPVTLHGVPQLSDIYTLLEIMGQLGTRHAWVGANSLTLHTPDLTTTATPDDLVSRLRASITLLGALLSRAGEAQVGMPGGCTFSERPIDQHLRALRNIGADIRQGGGAFHATRPRELNGSYLFEVPTVGGTQNAILACVLGSGEVTLENCSADTDVVDMVNFLNSIGADIRGAGTPTITVRPVAALHGGEYRVIPDRLEAGTWMIAAAATRGRVTLRNVITAHLRAVTSKLAEVGVTVLDGGGGSLAIDARNRTLRPANVTAAEFPGFPTDLQPIMGALLATVDGTSAVTDRIYARVSHVPELRRMGATIDVRDRTMLFTGGALEGTRVQAHDIRSGAAVVVAALAAPGETTIDGMIHLNRGYENLVQRLTQIGANARPAEPMLPAAMD